MTGDVVTWVVAVLQVVAAVGIITFWITWFQSPHEESWLPPGFVLHERAFVFPDSVVSLLLVASAVLGLFEQPLGKSLALVSAGMLLFLGVIDAAYMYQNGMFARVRGGVGHIAIVSGILTLSVILMARYL